MEPQGRLGQRPTHRFEKKNHRLFLTLRDVEEAQDCELQNLLEE